MEETLDSWFEREILAHEEALVRYLRRVWPNQDDVHDLRQEAYIRVYEAAGKSRPYAAKSFLFSSARHLMADRVRRSRIVSIEAVGDMDFLNVLVDEITPERQVAGRQELKRLAQAFDGLPPKCRRVLWMRKVEHMPQKEVAMLLGVDEKTVERHVTKGLRRVADYVFGTRSAADGAWKGIEKLEGGMDHG